MTNLHYGLQEKIEQTISRTEVFCQLETNWEQKVAATSFLNKKYPDVFLFADISGQRSENLEPYEDDGSCHLHAGNLHFGFCFGQDTRYCVSVSRRVATIAKAFLAENADLIAELDALVQHEIARLAPRNDQVCQLSEAVDHAQKALRAAEEALEAAINN